MTTRATFRGGPEKYQGVHLLERTPDLLVLTMGDEHYIYARDVDPDTLKFIDSYTYVTTPLRHARSHRSGGTMSKLDEIRERWEKVTPGPWALDPAFWSPPGWGEAMHYRRVVHGEPNKISGIRQPLFSTNGATDGSEQARQNHHDASAVAHAREDVPWLLAKIDRVEEQVKRIQETLHPTGNPMDTLAEFRKLTALLNEETP